MLLGLLLTIQIILCLALIGAVLLQRSEGGALGMGGGPSGFMTARGAGNLLTRVTAILATLFFLNSMGLTIAGNAARGGSSVVDRVQIDAIDPNALKGAPAAPAARPAPVPAAPAQSLDDLAAPLPQTGGAATAPAAPAQPAPAPAQ
ncbi:MAG TPA: preprotein translocase subunit SecG [Caulobacteraceae bacterium]|nr:preprotein translocase subunit SecG [Caulobacteraceae bacterium]